MLQKLLLFGFTEDLILLLERYLLDCRLYVSYNGFKSRVFNATSGVPEGYNLGLLLFVLFIYYLLTARVRRSFLETRIYSSINNISDNEQLQPNPNRLKEWCSMNNFSLNINKCKVVTYTKRYQPVIYDYFLNNVTLNRSTTVTDLEIVFNPQC